MACLGRLFLLSRLRGLRGIRRRTSTRRSLPLPARTLRLAQSTPLAQCLALLVGQGVDLTLALGTPLIAFFLGELAQFFDSRPSLLRLRGSRFRVILCLNACRQ